LVRGIGGQKFAAAYDAVYCRGDEMVVSPCAKEAGQVASGCIYGRNI